MALYFYSENLLFSNFNPEVWNAMYNKTFLEIAARQNIDVSKPKGQAIELATYEKNLAIFTLTVSCCIVILDFLELGLKLCNKQSWYKWPLVPKSNTSVQYTFYRCVQFMVAGLTLFLCVFILILANPDNDISIDLEALQVGIALLII